MTRWKIKRFLLKTRKTIGELGFRYHTKHGGKVGFIIFHRRLGNIRIEIVIWVLGRPIGIRNIGSYNGKPLERWFEFYFFTAEFLFTDRWKSANLASVAQYKPYQR